MPILQNPQWEKFAQEYVMDFDKKRAALAAGYCKDSKNEASIYTISLELYNREVIRARIKELLEERRKEYDITEARVLQEMSRIAFSDITEIIQSFGPDGVVYKDIKDIPKRIRPAIKSISTTANGIQVTFHDKIGSLEQLAKFLGMYEKDNKQKQADGPQIYLPHNNRDNLNLDQDGNSSFNITGQA